MRVGRDYTFECATGKSVIDVTFSHNLKVKLDNWRVCKAFNGSDHNTIRFELKVDTIEIPPHRPYETADWDLLKSQLGAMDIKLPTVIT